MTYRAPVSDIAFALKHAAGFKQALDDGIYGDLTEDVVDAVLEEAGKFATEVLGPLNVVGDRQGVVLQDGATTVCLTCDLDSILSRIKMDGSRPLAADRERMRALMAQREAAYRLADLTVETTSAAPADVAASLIRTLFPDRGAHGGTERR